jgi:hypothetical protein
MIAAVVPGVPGAVVLVLLAGSSTNLATPTLHGVEVLVHHHPSSTVVEVDQTS